MPVSTTDRIVSFIGRKTRFLRPSFLYYGPQYSPRPVKNTGCPVLLSEKDPPLISVVIPSYNQGEFLESAIRSILDQHYPRIQMLVVDGGSTDDSVDIIKRYSSDIDWWCCEPDNGQAHALNKGFDRSRGEIMAWLNADDALISGTFSRIACYMQERPDVGLVYGHRILIDRAGNEIGRWILPPHDDRVLMWADLIPQETMFWRRWAWEKAGNRIDDTFRFAMDWDLLLRFRASGAKMVRLPFFMGLFRVHSGQKTAKMEELGYEEMDRLRASVRGYAPARYRIAMGLAPYLLKARCLELLCRAGLIKYD